MLIARRSRIPTSRLNTGMEFLTLFHDAIGQWWLTTDLLRRIGDILVAVMAASLIFIGFGIWRFRDRVYGTAAARLLMASLDRSAAEKQIEGFFSGIASSGATAAYILGVDVDANTRSGIVAWASAPEERIKIEAISRDTPDSPLVGAELDLLAFKHIIEGVPFWLPDGRLLLPIPPVYRARKVALLIVHVRPGTTDAHRGVIEAKALAFAHRVGGTGR